MNNENGLYGRISIEEVFNRRFQALGGRVGFRGKYIDGIQLLAEWIMEHYETKRQLYVDVLHNENLNAYVTLEADVYLIGVTGGIVRKLFDQIGDVLKTLDIKFRDDFRSNEYDSPIKELQEILHIFALTFILGHEFGHIKLGHIDQQLSLRQMIDEKALSTSYLQEAEADTIGALSILDSAYLLSVNEGITRIRDLTNATTAVGLIQVPIACIFASLFGVNTPKRIVEGYPHPIVRLFLLGSILIRGLSVRVNNGKAFDDEAQHESQRYMTRILRSNFPVAEDVIFAESEHLGQKIRDLQNATQWIVDNWLEGKPLNLNQERARSTELRKQEYIARIEQIQKQKVDLGNLRNDFFSLFSGANANKLGKDLERVLNRYFMEYQIAVKEDFRRTGKQAENVIEHVGEIIEFDNSIYLAEMKWKKEPIGSDDVYSHLGSIYHRTNAHGILISASGYSASGISAAKEALANNALLVLFDLQEFVIIIEREDDFKKYLRDRIQAAINDKDPYKKSL